MGKSSIKIIQLILWSGLPRRFTRKITVTIPIIEDKTSTVAEWIVKLYKTQNKKPNCISKSRADATILAGIWKPRVCCRANFITSFIIFYHTLLYFANISKKSGKNLPDFLCYDILILKNTGVFLCLCFSSRYRAVPCVPLLFSLEIANKTIYTVDNTH